MYINSCICAFLRNLGVDIFKHNLCDAIQQVPLSKITVEQQADIENLRNLMFVRSEQSFIEGFDDTHIDCMIQYITGHWYYCLLLLVMYIIVYTEFLLTVIIYFIVYFLIHCIFMISTMPLCMMQIK